MSRYENKGQMHFCQTTRPITKFGTLTIEKLLKDATVMHCRDFLVQYYGVELF